MYSATQISKSLHDYTIMYAGYLQILFGILFLLLLFAHENECMNEWMHECMNERNVSICNCVSVCVCPSQSLLSTVCFFHFCFVEWIEYLLIWDWDKLEVNMNNACEFNMVHFQTDSSSSAVYCIVYTSPSHDFQSCGTLKELNGFWTE